VGHCRVGSIVFSNRGVSGFELTCSSSHKEIMEMQCDLLVSNFKNPMTIDLVKENIENISDGSVPHCAGPLTLGLKKAFDLKKQSKYVKLRCSSTYCSWYNNYVARAARPNNCCSTCGNWMQCVGCGYTRTGSYVSCQSCLKNFA
jgi:hypothetical protein